QERYENAKAPDMDNIIKPILDALTGPDGVLIDDCQVQTIGSHWIDWTKREHQINIFIKFLPDDYVTKKNLVFVNLGHNLFMPMDSSIPKKLVKSILDHFKKMFELRERAFQNSGDYYQAKMFMPIQRIFHKSRINESFRCMEISDFLEELKD
ncbi:MAG: RusA family crossover junction endodeoxyribonuclease, partial [Bacteroidota bacterium]